MRVNSFMPYALMGAFLIGIALGTQPASIIFWMIIGLIICSSLFVIQKTILAWSILLVTIGVSWGLFWNVQYSSFILKEGTQVVDGYVASDPQRNEFNTQFTVSIDNSHEQALVTLPHYPEYFYGDKIRMEGNVQYPENFVTDTGRLFDYVMFLRHQKIYYVMKYPKVSTRDGLGGSIIRYYLYRFKHMLLDRITVFLPEPHGSLMSGLLLGVKSSMGRELLDAFTNTGVIHIVVLSGFNVTIIAEAIMRMFRPLGMRISTVLSSISIIAFALMTGAAAPVVRASIMALIVIWARASGYQTHALRALCFAACVMVAYNPMILIYSLSFQLSFLASLALIVFVPWVERRLVFIPRTLFDFRGLAAASLATQVFVLPLLVYAIGSLSIISVIANILVLWVVPITMFAGFMMILASYTGISILLSLCVLISWSLLSYIISLVTMLSEVPYASVLVPSISLVTLCAMYGIYVSLYMFNRNQKT